MTAGLPEEPRANEPDDGRTAAGAEHRMPMRWLLAACGVLALILSAALPVLLPPAQGTVQEKVPNEARHEAGDGARDDALPGSLRDPNRRPPLRVRVEPVREGRIERSGEVTGVVHAFRAATVSAETSGRVIERHVEPGDRVEEGQPLLRLDDDEFRRRFRRTPIWRAHPAGLRRNALVVAAATGRVDLVPEIRRLEPADLG